MDGVEERKKIKDSHRVELRVKKVEKQRVGKDMFEVENKMKQHYERVKTRIKFNGIYDNYRASNTVRKCTAPLRHFKS